MIRRAAPKDLDRIVELAVESVSTNPLPVRIDRDAMREQARICMAPQNYLSVVEDGGEVIAAWAAETHSSFWHERKTSSVLLHYSRRPGAWVALARDFYRWLESRPVVRVAVLELEPESDPRMVRLLKRIGFTRQSTNLSYVRGLVCGQTEAG